MSHTLLLFKVILISLQIKSITSSLSVFHLESVPSRFPSAVYCEACLQLSLCSVPCHLRNPGNTSSIGPPQASLHAREKWWKVPRIQNMTVQSRKLSTNGKVPKLGAKNWSGPPVTSGSCKILAKIYMLVHSPQL